MSDVYDFADLKNWPERMRAKAPPLRLSVFGDPVAHSLSPQMHNAALEVCGIEARYCRLHIRAPELREALHLLPRRNFIGANLTIPHKQAALAIMDQMDGHAQKIGAVNTVAIESGKLVGFNTDGPGIVRAIRAEFGVDLRDLRVLVLGAGGGAGRAIAVQCAMENCERLVLVNRTFEKARDLAAELQPFFKTTPAAGAVARIVAVEWRDENLRAQIEHTDLILNATSVGLHAADSSPLAADVIPPRLLVYDTIYKATKTKLQHAAEQAGARHANGLSMLLHQGALSFEIWFNRPAPLEAMRRALLDAVNKK